MRFRFPQTVSSTGDGGDRIWLTEHLAERRHGDPGGAGELICIFVPCLLQQGLGADDSAVCAHQKLEHGKLLPGEFQVASCPICLPSKRIESEVGEFQDRLYGCGRVPRERTKTDDQFLQGERLGEIVVCTKREAAYLVSQPGRRGQHQYAHPGIVARYDLADVVTVRARYVTIENHDIVVIDFDCLQGIISIESDIGGNRLMPEARLKRFREELLVLDDQYAHL